MQSLQGAIRTAALVLGVLLLLVATLDAVPSPRDVLKNAITSADKCEQFLRTELGLNVKLPVSSMQETLANYNSFDQCAITYAILKSMQPSYYSDSLTSDESQRLGILEMLAQLGQNMIRDDLENSKRGLGFGMDRGFSGQQAARHLMGLHVATWPGGPGRRRRSDADEIKRGMGLGMDRAFSGQQAARYMMGADAANRIGKRSDVSASSGEPEE